MSIILQLEGNILFKSKENEIKTAYKYSLYVQTSGPS